MFHPHRHIGQPCSVRVYVFEGVPGQEEAWRPSCRDESPQARQGRIWLDVKIPIITIRSLLSRHTSPRLEPSLLLRMSVALMNSGLQAVCSRAAAASGQQQPIKPVRGFAAAAAPRQARRGALRVSNAIAEPSSAAKVNGTSEKLSLSELTAVGPLDGRYGSKVAGLRTCTSEYGLIKARALVEIRWLQMLSELPEVCFPSSTSRTPH